LLGSSDSVLMYYLSNQSYLRHLTSKPSENEDFGTYGDLDRELVLEQVRGAADNSVIGQVADLGASALADIDQPHSILMPPATPATPQKQKPGRKRKHIEDEPPNPVSILLWNQNLCFLRTKRKQERVIAQKINYMQNFDLTPANMPNAYR
jgi:hypothetical protein